MKKALKYIAVTLVSLLALLLVLPLCIYIPAVQRWGKTEICRYVNRSTEMQLAIGDLSLRFPFKLHIDDILLLTAPADTLLQSESIEVGIAPLGLLKRQVQVNEIALQGVRFRFASADSTLTLSAWVKEFATQRARIDLKSSLIDLPSSQLQGGDITLDITGQQPDTVETASPPLDWRISVGELGLSQIHYAMQMRPTIQQLDASIGQATLRQGNIDLYRQQVDVTEATIDRGDYRYYPGSGETVETAPEATAADTAAALPWTVRIARLRLHDNSALYALPAQIPQKGLDLGYLSLNGIEIAIDSLYNRGSEIRVPIRQLAFVERSGLAVTQTQGLFVMDSTGIALHDFLLRTSLSEISAQLKAGSELFAQSPQAPIEALVQARIAVGDLVQLFPQYSTYTRGLLLTTALQSDIAVNGTLGDLHLTRGDLSLPGTFNARTSGRVQHLPDTERLTGNLQWGIALRESPLIAHLMPDSLRNRLYLPPTRLSGKAYLAGPAIRSEARLETGRGAIDLRARLNTRHQRYEGDIHIDRFPLADFLPHDSLGLGPLSASIAIDGERYNPLDSLARLTAHLAIDTAQYAGYHYSGITVDARLNRGRATGRIACTDPNLLTGLSLSASIAPQRYIFAVSGDIHTDLEALRLTAEPCQLSTSLSLSGQMAPPEELYQASLQLDKLSALLPTGRLQTDALSLTAGTDSTQIHATLQSGDLAVRFASSIGLTPFLEKLNRAMPILASAQEEKRLNMEALHQTLPPFELQASAKRNNLVQQYLKGLGMGFYQFDLNTRNDSLLGTTGTVDRFSTGGIVIDTIQLSLFERHEREERLYYSLHVGNKPGNLDQLASVELNGFLSGNTTKLFCVQKNRQGEEGFRIGCQANFLDSLVQVSFFPKNPVIGFETWALNPDNFFAYHYGGHFDADIALTHGERHLIVTTLHESLNHTLARQEPLRVDISGMEIAPWLALSPFSPQIAGSISANLLVDFPQGGTQVAGNLGVSQFYYGKQRVGDFDLNVNYQLDSLGRQEARAALQIDSRQVLTLSGLLDDKADSPVSLQLAVDSLPLATANPFLPADMAQLQGFLNGEMQVGGSTSAPLLDGYLQMVGASANSKSMGASLNFPTSPIRVEKNVLRFDDYAITGANKNPLHIDGNIDFRDFAKINTDLHIFASAFQPVKAARSSKATVYGSVIADLDMRVGGPLDALKINGNVGLLTGTEVTYVMQDSPFALQQQENNIVTFVSFNDSTEVAETDTLPSGALLGMDILVNINISPTVKMGVNLSPDGKNRIDLQGGGNLTYTMNALGDSRFSGRYTLSGGFVRYNPPIISEKLFKIQDGSFVSWNGNIADPQMSITAVETVRTTITEDDKNSRQVNFDISIIIKNSLENLSVSFDLAAPEDLTLQNQLASLTAEQRASQAMSLLIYNTYTGPGTSTTRSDLLGNPLNSFLEKELNQWAQGLKGIDLSFGINSYTDASGINTRTDYSYRAAKSLFNNRVKVVIGGSLSPDDNADVNFKENFIDDISLEYYFNQRDNMYIKVFRHTGYESILEGEITQTGVGFVVKKQLVNLWELFRSRKTRKEVTP